MNLCDVIFKRENMKHLKHLKHLKHRIFREESFTLKRSLKRLNAIMCINLFILLLSHFTKRSFHFAHSLECLVCIFIVILQLFSIIIFIKRLKDVAKILYKHLKCISLIALNMLKWNFGPSFWCLWTEIKCLVIPMIL